MLPLAAVICSLQAHPAKAKPKKSYVYHTAKAKPLKPPHFASPAAKALTSAMLNAEAHLGRRRVDIRGEGGHIVVDWDSGKLRQDSAGGSWSYRGGVLSVACRKGFYRGSANKADVLDYLVALTGGADTFARQLLYRQRPFSDFFAPDETVRIGGIITLGGSPATILQMNGKHIRGTLMVRKSDHLVISAQATSLSGVGTRLYDESRTYSYSPLKSESVFVLRPRKGAKVRVLPKGAIHIGKRLVK